jgi:hypothetical protein
MVDASLIWAEDLTVSATGDIGTVSEPQLTEQRVLRRLLTNTQDYLWQPTYGAGLAAFVGTPCDPAAIEAVIRGQLQDEQSVVQTPEPSVLVDSDNNGNVLATLRYVDSTAATSTTLTFSIQG